MEVYNDELDAMGNLINNITVEVYDDNVLFMATEGSSGAEYFVDVNDADAVAEKFKEYYVNYVLNKLDEDLVKDIRPLLSSDVKNYIYEACREAYECGGLDEESITYIIEDLQAEGYEFDIDQVNDYFYELLNEKPFANETGDITEVNQGDLVDFGTYGELYVCNPDYSEDFYWVTDEEIDRNNPHAAGWSIRKNLALAVVNEDEEDDDIYEENLDEDIDVHAFLNEALGLK